VRDLVGNARREFQTLGLLSIGVGEAGEKKDLVERDPVFYTTAESLHEGVRVEQKGMDDFAVAPSAELFFKRLGQVSVEHCHPEGDSVPLERVEEPMVEIRFPSDLRHQRPWEKCEAR